MPKKVVNKTSKNDGRVEDYIGSLSADEQNSARALVGVFESVTASKATMWGATIIGFGEYTYYRANGAEGTFMATGFSIRKSGPVLYIMPGYQDFNDILKRLGKHKLGKSCLYVKKLNDIDMDVLRELIEEGLTRLKQTHDVRM